MKQLNFKDSNYDYKEELQVFVTSVNDLITKFIKSFDNRGKKLSKIQDNISKKKSSIDKIEKTITELSKRQEELQNLKDITNNEIKELEAQKGSIDFTDSEVQKMEIEDLDALIANKTGKISKIDEKLTSTLEAIKTNEEQKKTSIQELETMEKEKDQTAESLMRTEDLLSHIESNKDAFNNGIVEILKKKYNTVEEKQEEIKIDFENKKEVTPAETKKPTYDFELEEIELPYVETKLENTEKRDELSSLYNTQILTTLSADLEEPTVDINTRSKIDDVLTKEGIRYDLYKEEDRKRLEENVDTVLNNISVLKKYRIPLEFTIRQPKILYAINSEKLDELLSIISINKDGNGMNFSIDYTYYILDELADIDIEKLIDTYNREFMNINSKTGLISLLKMANPNLGVFKINRETNLDILKKLGVENVDRIEAKYDYFVDLDNPLFTSMLNLFDKNDLVNKLNTDISVIPKIYDYWKNN